jgi:hypothetical protein
MMPQRIVEVHRSSSNNGKHITNALLREKIRNVIGKSLFHETSP